MNGWTAVAGAVFLFLVAVLPVEASFQSPTAAITDGIGYRSNLLDPVNDGLVALAGNAGAPTATGALSGMAPAAGGVPNAGVFTDGDPTNDFFGARFSIGGVQLGELSFPDPGAGGGAGGDALPSNAFPIPG